MEIARTPPPPYYAVIFTSLKSEEDSGYEEMALEMKNLAAQQPGYLGYESAREGLGITVSYWKNMESIRNWKSNAEHLVAQKKGREIWYKHYQIRICIVERDYEYKN